MKMEKYKRAGRDVFSPKVGYGVTDELKRACFWVWNGSDKPQAADIGLRNHLVDMMDRRRVECLVLVLHDSDFVEVLKEARLRCFKSVVGDRNDGDLKRITYAGFLWQKIMLGKTKEAASIVGWWKDVLKRLEWTYYLKTDRKIMDWMMSLMLKAGIQKLKDFLPGKMATFFERKTRMHGGSWNLMLLARPPNFLLSLG